MKYKLSKLSGCGGFLLLELVLSVVIITGGLLVVSRSYSTCKNMLAQSRTLLRVSPLIDAKMFEFQASQPLAGTGAEGSFADEARHRWRLAPGNY